MNGCNCEGYLSRAAHLFGSAWSYDSFAARVWAVQKKMTVAMRRRKKKKKKKKKVSWWRSFGDGLLVKALFQRYKYLLYLVPDWGARKKNSNLRHNKKKRLPPPLLAFSFPLHRSATARAIEGAAGWSQRAGFRSVSNSQSVWNQNGVLVNRKPCLRPKGGLFFFCVESTNLTWLDYSTGNRLYFATGF